MIEQEVLMILNEHAVINKDEQNKCNRRTLRHHQMTTRPQQYGHEIKN